MRADIPFIPHIALGHLAASGSDYDLKNPKALGLDVEKYEQARAEIERLGLQLSYTATKIELITVDDEFTHSQTLARFALGD